MKIKLPPVTDEDIFWVTKIMGLPEDAFAPEKDGGARMAILKSEGESMDIEACPGSGKTTLLVAKLAIMARHWPSRRQGICVLSHTNVAKDEIQKRLGNTDEGRALLSYPHYIGTIHGFVNEYLSFPWIRSRSDKVIVVDDELVKSKRLKLLAGWGYKSLKFWVDNQRDEQSKIVDSWVVSSSDYEVKNKDGSPVFKSSGPASGDLKRLVRDVSEDGYYRYDEMFAWAFQLMDISPGFVEHIRRRFEFLFVDEAQDNSFRQSLFLYRVFMGGDAPVFRVRLGDSDQAIYDGAYKDSSLDHDQFPNNDLRRVLANSHRFDQSIANLASRTSVSKIKLLGTRISDAESQKNRHVIFLLDDETLSLTLDVYGRHIIETLGADQEKLDEMIFTAVGAVHNDKEGSEKNMPHNVKHYFSDYDAQINSKDARPDTFLQYVSIGLKSVEELAAKGSGGESFHIVEKLGKGFIEAAKKVSPDCKYPSRNYHRFILDALTDTECESDEGNNAPGCYSELIEYFCIKKQYPGCQYWDEAIRNKVVCVVGALARAPVNVSDAFFAFPESQSSDLGSKSKMNIYSVDHNSKNINIRLGSIHSVKGETHTATLLLETFRDAHHIKKILDLLCGSTRKIDKDEYRLKLCYVAMTRPSHILCVAMRKDAFFDEKKDPKSTRLNKLKAIGWRVAVVTTSGECEWL
jgi:DNA helicase II / ATP-dependent DNA helicase PcrA